MTDRKAGLHPTDRRKDLVLVLEAKSKREENLALGIHSTVHTLLDAMNRAKRDFCFSSKLGLCHQPIFPQLSDPILTNRPGLTAFHTVALPQSPNPAMPFCIGVNLDAISSELGNSLEKMRRWRIPTAAVGTPASATATDRCGALTHTKAISVNPKLGSRARMETATQSSNYVGLSLRPEISAEASC